MSLKEIEDLKQHYLDEMLSLSNDLGIKDYRNEKINIRFRRECEDTIHELKGKFNRMSIEINKRRKRQYLEQVANLNAISSQCFNSFCYDDDDDYDYEESAISLNETISQEHPFIANTSSEDISGSDSECILPSYDDLSPIDVPEEKVVTFSNPLFNSNDHFISSGDDSLSDEDVSEDNIKIYSNLLFEFDDEYISSDVNPLFDEVLENIESKDSYDSNLDEPDLLVTPLFDADKDECFDSGGDDDEINVLDFEDGYYDSEGDILYLESLLNDDLVHHNSSILVMSVASILEGFIDELPLEENDELFDLEPKNDDWKKILYGAPILMTEDKVFNPGIHDQIFSPTYVSLPFTNRHYLFFTYVV
uniref:Uncharacterized protein n=1 Tax=Tanacetum cinerariifolium TaxID=118510 RepID=A0A699K6M4_TANCI|nr:hypothetical protein [Tanacetum cinerariifolium]